MKNVLLLFYFLIVCLHFSKGQNLVPNSSFENFTSCPDTIGQIAFADPWFSSNGGTADFFHSCGGDSSDVSVPISVKAGMQVPLTGNGYAGIRVFADGGPAGKEYLGVELLEELVSGKRYLISFNVVLSEESSFAISDLGLYLSPIKLTQGGGVIDDVTPQIINQSGIIDDADEWTRISSCYEAQGGEKFVTIGNFNTDENTNWKYVLGGNIYFERSYYLFDDISILEIEDAPSFGYDSVVCQVDEHAFEFHQEDSLLSLFSDASTSITVEQTLDTVKSYFLEVETGNCTFLDTATFFQQPTVTVDLGVDTVLCEGDSLRLVSSASITGTNLWSDGETDDTLLVTKEGLYSLVFTDRICEIKDSIFVDFLEVPDIELADSFALCQGEKIVLEVEYEGADYLWNNNSTDNSLEVSKEGEYTVKASNICGADEASAYVSYDFLSDLVVPNVVTPNNDKFNDYFVLEGVENCQLELEIINRWGKQIYYALDYKNDWPNEDLNSGTYFYSISGESSSCQSNGWIQLIK